MNQEINHKAIAKHLILKGTKFIRAEGKVWHTDSLKELVYKDLEKLSIEDIQKVAMWIEKTENKSNEKIWDRIDYRIYNETGYINDSCYALLCIIASEITKRLKLEVEKSGVIIIKDDNFYYDRRKSGKLLKSVADCFDGFSNYMCELIRNDISTRIRYNDNLHLSNKKSDPYNYEYYAILDIYNDLSMRKSRADTKSI